MFFVMINFHFTNVAGIWSQQQKLVASDREADDRFGSSVAISGKTAIVGAYKEYIKHKKNQKFYY